MPRREHLAHLTRVLSDPQGREYLYDFLASCHMYTTSFSSNALTMAFLEGERNTAIRLCADLVEASPEMYLQMIKEFGNVRRPPSNKRTSDSDGAEHDSDEPTDA